ncbi:hypothetical protein TNCV_2808681 [Trichonephila clavipes]|nr:hypothetical protein TNCV_2808681 [Trichonephila clavipes]
MACDAEDCVFQMLNDDEIVTSVHEESDPVDDKVDDDEGNNNNERPSSNLTRRLVARRLFSVPPCHESTKHLQTHMPSPGFESRPFGTAVSVVNHYTRRVTFNPST